MRKLQHLKTKSYDLQFLLFFRCSTHNIYTHLKSPSRAQTHTFVFLSNYWEIKTQFQMDERIKREIFLGAAPSDMRGMGVGWVAPAAPVHGICYFHEINSSPAGLKVRIKHSVAPE